LDILVFFNHLRGVSWTVDCAVYCVSDNHLLKGGIFMAALWWFWFFRSPMQARNRALVVSSLFACVLAIGVTQAVRHFGPFRLRPCEAGVPGVQFPYAMGMRESTSFPSDHATLFGALAMALFYLSRNAGIVAAIYGVVAIFLPRIYLGLHYPTDIIAGVMIGMGTVWLVNGTRLRAILADPVMKAAGTYPACWHAGLFLLSYQIATLFDDLRSLGSSFLAVVHGLWR